MKYFKMRKINFYIFLVICIASMSLAKVNDMPYCYELTWIVPIPNANPDKYNCSVIKGVPCIKPPIISEKRPNVLEYWENSDMTNTTGLCAVTSGNVCMKYSYLYNSDIVNTTLFCGKIIEDDHVPVTSGCYEQRKDGYVLEICACRSIRGEEPCNVSVQTTYSNILIITILLFTFMKFTY